MIVVSVLIAFVHIRGVAAASALCSVESPQLPCSAGGCYFNAQTNTCEHAPAGRFSPVDDNRHYRCQPGSFSIGAAASCVLCPLGHFTNEYGSKACHPCGIARYSSTLGSKRCQSCNPARYIGYGAREAILEFGATFCVAPELTVPPTQSPTHGRKTPTLSPTRSPQELPHTIAPQLSETPSAPVFDSTLTPDVLTSPSPTVIARRPTSSPTPHASKHLNPSPSKTPTIPRVDAATSERPSHGSAFPDGVTAATSIPAPTDRIHTEATEAIHIWLVLLPNLAVACVLTSFACCWFIAAGPPTDDKANATARVVVDEDTTTTTGGSP